MMKEVRELFGEKGDLSMMRVMSFLCVTGAIYVAVIGLGKPSVDYSGLSLLCSTFLAAAMGGKVAQKRLENESNVNKE